MMKVESCPNYLSPAVINFINKLHPIISKKASLLIRVEKHQAEKRNLEAASLLKISSISTTNTIKRVKN